MVSIIAYDGRIIAADRQGTTNNMACTLPKLRQYGGQVLGFVGDAEAGLLLMDWYVAGADPDEWPEKAQDDDDSRALLVVANKHAVGFYAQFPVLCQVHDPFHAWGCGRNMALGVMAHQASTGMQPDARKAVELTCQYDVYCGGGVDWFDLAKCDGKQTAEERVRKKVKGKEGRRK